MICFQSVRLNQQLERSPSMLAAATINTVASPERAASSHNVLFACKPLPAHNGVCCSTA
jgi:hypothetical protein